MLWFAGPFIGAGLLLLLLAYVSLVIRKRSAGFDRFMVVLLDRYLTKKTWSYIAVLALLILVLIFWDNGNYYDGLVPE